MATGQMASLSVTVTHRVWSCWAGSQKGEAPDGLLALCRCSLRCLARDVGRAAFTSGESVTEAKLTRTLPGRRPTSQTRAVTGLVSPASLAPPSSVTRTRRAGTSRPSDVAIGVEGEVGGTAPSLAYSRRRRWAVRSVTSNAGLEWPSSWELWA